MRFEQQENCLYISGEITVHTLNKVMYQQFLNQLMLPEIELIDFSQIHKVDSVGIALLLAVQRCCQHHVKILSLPQSVDELVRLYEIQDWIQS